MEWLLRLFRTPAASVDPGAAGSWTEIPCAEGRSLQGHFAVYRNGVEVARVDGCIVERPYRDTAVFVHSPPAWLLAHPDGGCLQLYGPGSPWYRLHWEVPVKTFSESLAFMEQMLEEAWRLPREHAAG